MKILFLNNYNYIRGGSERVYFAEMDLMKERGHEVIAFARRHRRDFPSLYSEYFPPDMKTDEVSISWDALKTVKEIIYSTEARKSLGMLTRFVRPDIAHAHNIYGRLSTSVLDCLREEGIPIVMTLHDYKLACPTYNFTYHHAICEDCKSHRYYRAVLKKCHKGSYAASAVYVLESYFNRLFRKYENTVDRFIAPSRFLKSKIIEYGWPVTKIAHVPNCIRSAEYQPEYEPGTYFLFLGRLSEEKGIRTLIRAFTSIENPNAGLVIAGDGPLKELLQNMACSDSRIRFTGYLTGPVLRDITRRALAVVLPSVCYENAPLSILEASAYGKPVIGSAIGGIPEMIDDGRNGFLFTPGNEIHLAEKMKNLLSLTRESLIAMGKAAREKITNDFSADAHYQKLMSIYNSLLHQ